MGFKGKKVVLEEDRTAAVLYDNETRMFMLEFSMPVPEGYTAEDALTQSRQNKVFLKDGKLNTSITLTYGAFMAMMSMGVDIANEAIFEQDG